MDRKAPSEKKGGHGGAPSIHSRHTHAQPFPLLAEGLKKVAAAANAAAAATNEMMRGRAGVGVGGGASAGLGARAVLGAGSRRGEGAIKR